MFDEILKRARRRIVLDRLLSSLSIDVAILLGALVILFVLGTRIWDCWTPALLFSACFGADVVRALFGFPSLETVARFLDQRCALADTLATAVHFRTSSLDIAEAQRRRAERAAREIDVSQAIPFYYPKSLYAVAALGVAASTLFLYRFGTERELNFSVPIAHLNLDALGLAARADDKARGEQARKADRRDFPTSDSAVNRLGTSTSDNPGEKDAAGPSGTAVTTGAQKNDANAPATADGKKTGDPREPGADPSDPGAAPPKQGADQPPSANDGAPQNAQSGNKSPGKPDSSGLLSKLRDAVSNLISKMKPQGNQSPPGGTQAAQPPNGKPPAGQPGASQAGKPEGKGTPSDQDGEESASSDTDQSGPGKGAGKSNDAKASAKPGSGMGHQDGSKELKDAEQLNAMGKLSEIIGKRSANVTGEMTIEPQNGPQQLKTGYTHSTARHGATSGDVNRDEVPLALQGYVQQYYEEVRKQAAAKPKSANN